MDSIFGNIEQILNNTTPQAPWRKVERVGQAGGFSSQHKPAMCEYEGKLFLTWANVTDNSFMWTTFDESDAGWQPIPGWCVLDGKKQAHTSALVVFNKVLYAIIPWQATDPTLNPQSGCDFLRYDGTTFNQCCTNTIPGPFSDNNEINEQSTSNPSLYVRDGKVRLMFLAAGDGRSVLETHSTMGASPPWARSHLKGLDESGNSGISAISSPEGDRSWICFKTHDGSSNLICHWEEEKISWSGNIVMGSGIHFITKNEAALSYFNTWVYAVWNVVDQTISISALSIPGTHDSCSSAWHDLPSPLNGWIRCQDMSITQQLNAGIRYFDIRASYKNIPARNRGEQVPLTAVHGDYVLGLSIEDVLGFFYAWLDTHPTEAVILQLKDDGKTTNSQYVSNDFYTLIQPNLAKYWLFAETIPTLDQIKGKIQLVRRVPVPNACRPKETFGIKVYNNWPQNAAGAINNPLINPGPIPASLWVEDNYTFDQNGSTALQEKKQNILDFLTKASGPLAPPTAPVWYIGYSSYVTDWNPFPPDSNFNYATENLGTVSMNQSLEEIINAKGGYNRPALVGTIVMNYPNWKSGTLIGSIIYTDSLNLST
ncbi:PLC-like phosphodiesterase [Fusarium agapanthi]|uniref:PLC-like phosphodiesterase n=1 Tax=Fusarium agapanthi TaxID=1803897 RepID=A0A9P5B597_9HYPO|nr:PLC-like phosphodiesterase [Fusarium agapanthi]